jgi:fatty-acyl-CoA synthase
VIGVADPTWGEIGVAFVVPRAGQSIDTGTLAAFLGGRLARFKLPKHFVAIDALPRTAYGKVVKAELAARWAKRQGSGDRGQRTGEEKR